MPTTNTYQLRKYQQELVDRIVTEWKSGKQRVMAQLPTGGGKTILFGNIARKFAHAGKRVLILAHREELVLQAAEKVGAIAELPIGIIKAGYKPEPSALIQIASVQSMVNRLSLAVEFDLTIVDEAHHSTANTYRSILKAYPKAQVLGVTATPIRLDGSGFIDLYDELICGVTVTELIQQGHLSRFKLYADPDPMTTKGARKTGGDFNAKDIARLNDPSTLSGNLLESYRRHANGLRCVVFAVTVAHSQAIAAEYSQAGIKAVHLDGTTPSQERAEALERFKQGEIKVICNCALFDEGLDIPALDAVQIAKPTKSLSRWLQMFGRSLRTAEGKSHAIVIDHTKNWAIHGLPTHPRIWTLEGVKSEQVKLTLNPDREVVEQPEIVVIERAIEVVQKIKLKEISEQIAVSAAWASQLQRLYKQQQQRGYKPSWVMFELEKLNPPLEVWQQFGVKMGYKEGWAWHKWNSFQPEEPTAAEPTADEYFQSSSQKYRQQDYQGGLSDLNRAIELEPERTDFYLKRALVKEKGLGDIEGALDDYNRAIQQKPDWVGMYLLRASLKADKLKYKVGSMADFNRAIQLAPNYAEAYYKRGIVRCELIKDLDGGIKDLEHAAKLYKDQGSTELHYRAVEVLEEWQQINGNNTSTERT